MLKEELCDESRLDPIVNIVSDAIGESRLESRQNSKSFQEFVAGALKEASTKDYELTPKEIAGYFQDYRMYRAIDAIEKDPIFCNHCSRIVSVTKLRKEMDNRSAVDSVSLTENVSARLREELNDLEKPFMERMSSWHLLPAKSQYEIMEQDFLRKRTIRELLAKLT